MLPLGEEVFPLVVEAGRVVVGVVGVGAEGSHADQTAGSLVWGVGRAPGRARGRAVRLRGVVGVLLGRGRLQGRLRVVHGGLLLLMHDELGHHIAAGPREAQRRPCLEQTKKHY